ncbi:hypothetical protein EDD16DRAFT_1724019 [Pisolithus croceorrhizus]|nr:hypothetical protein EDD16DRAFT_1724019 [Pisolithus croceorrhizus]
MYTCISGKTTWPPTIMGYPKSTCLQSSHHVRVKSTRASSSCSSGNTVEDHNKDATVSGSEGRRPQLLRDRSAEKQWIISKELDNGKSADDPAGASRGLSHKQQEAMNLLEKRGKKLDCEKGANDLADTSKALNRDEVIEIQSSIETGSINVTRYEWLFRNSGSWSTEAREKGLHNAYRGNHLVTATSDGASLETDRLTPHTLQTPQHRCQLHTLNTQVNRGTPTYEGERETILRNANCDAAHEVAWVTSWMPCMAWRYRSNNAMQGEGRDCGQTREV